MIKMAVASSNTSCSNDETLGPFVVGCRDDFDFTVAFEDSFLSIAPSAAFAVFSLLRLVYLSRKRELFHARILQLSKLVEHARCVDCFLKALLTCELQGVIAVYAALQVVLLALFASSVRPRSTLTFAAACLSLFDSLVFLGLSAWEHSRSRRSSIILNVYLLISLVLDAARVRTSWLVSPDADVVKVSTASLAVKVLILVLESQGKERWLPGEKQSPEETGGVFTLSFFSWLNTLIASGYRKVLAQGDLHAIDRRLSAEAYQAAFNHQWQTSKPGKHRLVRSVSRTLGWSLFYPVLPRIVNGALSFAQPFLVNAILEYLQQDYQPPSRNVGYGLIGATALIYSGLAVSNGLYQYLHQRALAALRASLITIVYDTTIAGASSHAHDNSAAVTLMSSDVNRIQVGLDSIHECWANSIEIAIAAWLLQRQLGTAFVAPIVVVLICAAASFGVGKFTGKRMGFWMSSVQSRVGMTANIINNITPVKMLGLQESITAQLQASRQEEMSAAKRFRVLTTAAGVLAYAPLLLSPAVTFATTSHELTIARAFTSLAAPPAALQPPHGLVPVYPADYGLFCLFRPNTKLSREECGNKGCGGRDSTASRWSLIASAQQRRQPAAGQGWQFRVGAGQKYLEPH